MIEDTEVERVLAVAAHPDDLDFGASGTIAGWTAAGIEVVYVIVTDGDAGGFDPEVPRERIPKSGRRSSGRRPPVPASPTYGSSAMPTGASS